jgi:hypothetical protein
VRARERLVNRALLNLDVLWMGARAGLARRPSPIQGMLPHLVVQMGALLSGPILALFVRRVRGRQALKG